MKIGRFELKWEKGPDEEAQGITLYGPYNEKQNKEIEGQLRLMIKKEIKEYHRRNIGWR